ncbi:MULTISPECIES: hypothetical protein [Streptomyces]|uniref:hypothetical protein n=1 Tax=Streptomyces TaxID=1883 RepID=UPI000B9EC090|nr:hypothetical protein [Streptomyces kasugaensis]
MAALAPYQQVRRTATARCGGQGTVRQLDAVSRAFLGAAGQLAAITLVTIEAGNGTRSAQAAVE